MTKPKPKGRRPKRQPAKCPAVGDGSMCRVCARWGTGSSKMVPIFGHTILGRACALSEAIGTVGAVLVHDGDGLPQFCCTCCLRQVESAYKLRQLCQESDRKLRELFPAVPVVEDVKPELDAVNPLRPEEVVCKPEVDLEEVEASALEVPVKDEIEEPETESELKAESDDCNEKDDAMDFEESEDDIEDVQEPAVTEAGNKSSLSEDLYEEVPATGFRCCGCKMRFETDIQLRAHGQVEHAARKLPVGQLDGKVQCDICYRTLRSAKLLVKHQEKENSEYRCKICGDMFIRRQRVASHYRTMHGPNANVPGSTRICCGCAQQFDSQEALGEHTKMVHLPERPAPDDKRPFVCDICFHNFPSETGLYDHQTRLTKNVKKYQCTECGKRYLHPGQLRDHEKTHLGEKVFQCSKCPAAYVSRESLRKHVQRHTMPGDKYKCNVCGRCYRSSKALKEHARSHTGERPHRCPYCPASFVRDTSLALHIKVHTGQKDYECPQCGKRFTCSSNLAQHVNFYHQKARPFGCFFCERRYPRKDYRKRHMESAHAAELLANPVPAIDLAGSTQWLNK